MLGDRSYIWLFIPVRAFSLQTRRRRQRRSIFCGELNLEQQPGPRGPPVLFMTMDWGVLLIDGTGISSFILDCLFWGFPLIFAVAFFHGFPSF